MTTFTTTAQTVTVTDGSGTKHPYKKYDLSTNFPSFAANYLFVKMTPAPGYIPIYAGQTGNMSERFDNHHKMDAIRRAGATHILVFANSKGEKARLDHESNIIRVLKPKCNG